MIDLSLIPLGVQPVPRSAPKLIQDERPYAELLRLFVGRHVGAAEFLARFSHLWRCDGSEGRFLGSAIIPMTRSEAALYATLDALNELCEVYWRSLPAGRGCRISEEQFRSEIDQLASTNEALRPRG